MNKKGRRIFMEKDMEEELRNLIATYSNHVHGGNSKAAERIKEKLKRMGFVGLPDFIEEKIRSGAKTFK